MSALTCLERGQFALKETEAADRILEQKRDEAIKTAIPADLNP